MKLSSSYTCQQCGYIASQYLGRCPECGNWGTLVEEIESKGKGRGKTGRVRGKGENVSVVHLSDIEKQDYDRLKTGIDEFDRVLGGGIVKGSLILVSGDPGIGKSTLLTQLALNLSQKFDVGGGKLDKEVRDLMLDNQTFNALYIAGEESPRQIKLRAERISKSANLAVLNELDVDVITQVIESAKPCLVVVDSIQTIQTADLESVAGSIGQVRESAHRLQRTAKSLHVPIFLVGHVTKEGSVAGPKTLEHLVDVVLSLEGDPSSQLRILRSTKNRFGSTDEVGIFEMEESGLKELKNPSELFLNRNVNSPGSATVAIVTGLRPLLVEIQALVVKSNLSFPRRVGIGVDNNRLQLLVAIVSKRLGLNLFDKDVFVNVTGGIKLTEPSADLGICMAVASAYWDKPVKTGTVFIGEVGLLGEVRKVRDLKKRANEAKKLGFGNPLSAENISSLEEAVKLAI